MYIEIERMLNFNCESTVLVQISLFLRGKICHILYETNDFGFDQYIKPGNNRYKLKVRVRDN